mgnify:FL=1
MKLLIENWRKFMTEASLDEAWAGTKGFGSLIAPRYMTEMSNAGEAKAAFEAGEKLQGWDEYGRLVYEAYRAAPNENSAGLKSFNALIPHIDNNFKRIIGRDVAVEFVGVNPYASAEEMLADARKTGVLKISTEFNQESFYGPERNLKFRTVHDYYAHLSGGKKGDFKPPGFTWEGELRAYNKHLNFVGKQGKMVPALFTEIIGQAATYFYTGDFPDQKVIALSGFDYSRLGSVQGYDIVDGDLIKSGEREEPPIEEPSIETPEDTEINI